jgi:broad specificity phosphatase PhoE
MNEKFSESPHRESLDEWEKDYSYLFEGEKIEREKDRAIMKLVFIRHGEKELTSDSETDLTYRGKFEAAILGTKRDAKDSVEINYSPTVRTAATGETANLSEKLQGKMQEEKLLSIEGVFSDEFREEMMDIKKEMLTENLSDLSSEDQEKIDQAASSKQLENYLSYGSDKPDEQTLSPEELATRIAEIINRYTESLSDKDKYKPNSINEVINVTHDVVVASFLAANIKNFTFDTPIRPGEGFEVIIKGPTEAEREIEMSLFFQGKEYPLKLDQLK